MYYYPVFTFPFFLLPFPQISQNLGKIYSEMIFVNGFVHCDPHPGNVLVRKCPESNKTEIVLLDHGLYQVRHRPRPPQTRQRSKFITYYTPLFTRWLPGQLRTQACMCCSRLKAFHLSGPEAPVCLWNCTFPPPSYYKQMQTHRYSLSCSNFCIPRRCGGSK